MSLGHLETALKEIEQQFDAVSLAIVKGEPVELDRATAVLKDMAADFSTLLQAQSSGVLSNPGLKARVLALKDGLSSHRTSLIRRSVHVECALNALMPSTRASTYAAQSGRYGANARQTGAFKVLAA